MSGFVEFILVWKTEVLTKKKNKQRRERVLYFWTTLTPTSMSSLSNIHTGNRMFNFNFDFPFSHFLKNK